MSPTNPDNEMESIERSFHESYKPTWGPKSTLLYAIPGKVDFSKSRVTVPDPILKSEKQAIVSEGRDIRFARLTSPSQVSALCFPNTRLIVLH